MPVPVRGYFRAQVGGWGRGLPGTPGLDLHTEGGYSAPSSLNILKHVSPQPKGPLRKATPECAPPPCGTPFPSHR